MQIIAPSSSLLFLCWWHLIRRGSSYGIGTRCLPLVSPVARSAATRQILKRGLSVQKYLSALSDDISIIGEGTNSVSGRTIRKHDFARSCITRIRSKNLAGIVSVSDELSTDNNDVIISIEQDKSHLVCVTGESGHGKSLLFFRVIELLKGGKASPTYLTAPSETALVELEVLLREPTLSAVRAAFEKAGLDDNNLVDRHDEKCGKLILTRQLSFQNTSQQSNPRLKSLCQINGQSVTLKVLSSLASPLLTLVDASTAATALSKPESRLAALDTAVPFDILERVEQTRKRYRRRRLERENLEDELAARTLPVSFMSLEDGGDLELLSHWIDELDAFEKRATEFCRSLVSDDATDGPDGNDLGRKLATTTWDHRSKSGNGYSSTMFALLSEFRDTLQSLDNQQVAAMNALETIGSHSSGNSAVTAVEKARNFLFKASMSETADRISLAAEGAHELLNEVESALEVFRRFVEDSDQGLLRSLESAREKYPVSVEIVDEILLDWKWLARKHGIHPSTLPSCHRALANELSGNVEARSLLPQAIAEEKAALADFEEACADLSEQRQSVAASLSVAVSRRLPALGMENAAFFVSVQSKARSCSDFLVYMPGGTVGIDSVDFMLNNVGAGGGNLRQGSIDAIASSGEKARILLAIECALPGSVGAACSSANVYSNEYYGFGIGPIAVIYDEIDSHVGGRAAVAMSQMLRDQSDSSQVIAITHSASVAASADTHIVIQKSNNVHGLGGATPVQVRVVCDDERRKELARMASGDLAAEEAQIFADALLREGRRRSDA